MRAKREAKNFLDYLREPSGRTLQYYLYWGNTKHIEENFLYYLREPPGDPPNTTYIVKPIFVVGRFRA